VNGNHQIVVCVVLLALCWRAVQLKSAPDSELQYQRLSVHCSLLPDIATAPLSELALLPGLGLTRARSIVEGRHLIGIALTPERVGFIDGVGDTTATELSMWYRAQRRRGDTLKYKHEPRQTDPRAN
jgi:hypothetical protein